MRLIKKSNVFFLLFKMIVYVTNSYSNTFMVEERVIVAKTYSCCCVN